jgi:hypothetical protein
MRASFDEVHDSIHNGQFKQAVKQMDDIGMSDLPRMLDYFVEELNQPELAIKAAKSYFRNKAR